MPAIFPWIKKNWLHLSILTALVTACYIGTLTHQFVSDDRSIVLNAASWGMDDVFARAHYSLRLFFYIILYQINGLDPVVFRSFNLLLHLANVYLVYYLVKLLAKPRVAFIASALFAVHPILTESVTWISGGVYPQYSFFFLLSLITYIKSKNIWLTLASAFFYALALLSSEKSLSLIAMFFLYEISFGSIRKNWKKLLPLLGVIVIFGLYYFSLLNNRLVSLQQDYYQTDSGYYNSFVQIPTAITTYLQMIFWPSGLSFYQTEIAYGMIELIIRGIITLAIIGLWIWSFFKNKFMFFWLSLVGVALLPTLTPIRVAWIVAERYFYLSAVGVFVVLAYLFNRIFTTKLIKQILYGVLAVLILALMIRTINRNLDWESEDTLWLATAQTAPSSHNNHNNLGDYYSRHGDYESAIREFQTAISILPNYADAYHNLANTYQRVDKPEEALYNYQQALKYNPKLWQSHQNIAILFYTHGDFEQAKISIEKAVEILPNNPETLVTKGIIYLESGNKEVASQVLGVAASLDPYNPRVQSAVQMLKQSK